MNTFNHWRGRHLDIDGARIYVEEAGNPEGPALVCLHGGFGQMETWNALTPGLAATHRLIGIDSRGHGRSTLGAPLQETASPATALLTFRRLEEDVKAVVKQLGLSRYSVIGHSDGGIVALRLAADATNPVEHIIPIGAQWELPPDDPARGELEKITPAFWREHFPGTDVPHGVGAYERLNPAPDFDQFAQAVRALWLSDGPDAYPGESIRNIRAKTLLVHGEGDEFIPLSHTQAILQRIGGARLLHLPMTGHSAHEERPAWLLPVVQAFLQT